MFVLPFVIYAMYYMVGFSIPFVVVGLVVFFPFIAIGYLSAILEQTKKLKTYNLYSFKSEGDTTIHDEELYEEVCVQLAKEMEQEGKTNYIIGVNNGIKKALKVFRAQQTKGRIIKL